MSDPKFFCHGCGLCCKHVNILIMAHKNSRKKKIKNLVNKFPYKPKLDGSCEMLDDNNQCKVYDNRPEICNILLSKRAFNPTLSLEKYYARVEDSCKWLMSTFGNFSQDEIDEIYKNKK